MDKVIRLDNQHNITPKHLEGKMNKTFEIKTTITIPEEVANEEIFQEFKNSILSGETQRDWVGGRLGILKCTITLIEINKN